MDSSSSGSDPDWAASLAAPASRASPAQAYLPGQAKSLSGIAVRAFCLGSAATAGALAATAIVVLTDSPLWRLPFFLAALASFHFLEFWSTAAYNTPQAEVRSFLLSANWPGWAIAHTAASLECLLANLLFPRRPWAGAFPGGPLLLALGFVLVGVGQAVRTAAMAHAGRSFNHIVQHTRAESHALITTGIYGALRHPSYFGFFWWALGTQLVLGNPVCFCGYAAVLWRFFSRRIAHEEELLVHFFGEEYADYRRRVGTKIPFVP